MECAFPEKDARRRPDANPPFRTSGVTQQGTPIEITKNQKHKCQTMDKRDPHIKKSHITGANVIKKIKHMAVILVIVLRPAETMRAEI